MRKQNLKKLSEILDFTPQIDGLLSALKNDLVIDVIAFDQQLQNKNPEYNPTNCTYENKNVSMTEFIQMRYGSLAVELIETLI